ncbi:secretoglobin family 1D member 2-like isoform X1 [Myotis daubentonii]|uniref:secretoglobin family 1D member 2-like isoform X1 n=1 Tax=Myotis daubentonii TaxID=98922 RepID=UPI0028732D19|nr:secretoglobin family 1D member 2-like isoform X1 [Myotis daubentonii]
MKLALSLLLVTLALCCSDGECHVHSDTISREGPFSGPANAKVCPALHNEARSFLLDIKPLFYSILKTFPAPEPAYHSTMAVKYCVDQMSFSDRHKIYDVVEAIVKKCNQ